MNFKRWFNAQRKTLSQFAVGLWGLKENGLPITGTGILIKFKDYRLVCSCWHVLQPIKGLVYVLHGRETFQNNSFFKLRVTFEDIDFGFLLLDDYADFPSKIFINANFPYLGDVESGIPLINYGFPNGHPKIQKGFEFDFDEHKAWGNSMTYLSISEGNYFNGRLKKYYPTIRWIQKETFSSKTFEINKFPIDPGGFSGGPVFLPNANNRLAGYVTDVDSSNNRRIFYIPIRIGLERIEKYL